VTQSGLHEAEVGYHSPTRLAFYEQVLKHAHWCRQTTERRKTNSSKVASHSRAAFDGGAEN